MNVKVTHALSFLQPWLWMMVHGFDGVPFGVKDVENRTWSPPRDRIGTRIALHASKGFDADAMMTILRITGIHPPYEDEAVLHRGCIVATAVIQGSFRSEQQLKIGELPHSKLTSPWFFGPVGWILEDIIPLPAPIPMKGALMLWEMSNPIEVDA